MKFLIAVFWPPRLLFWLKFASLPVYSALPFYLKLETIRRSSSLDIDTEGFKKKRKV